MAHVVHRELELQVDDLHTLQQLRLFSSDEVRQIVRRRTALEYAVVRRQVELHDWVRYLQYELQLEKLHAKRRKRLRIKSPTTMVAMHKRLIRLHERAIKRFPKDLGLWLQYFAFCKRIEAARRLARAFPRALQLHSDQPGLWVMAASWEYENNHNIVTARALMQRALRFNPGEHKLWHEYCRLELLYWDKLRQRLALVDTAVAAAKERRAHIDMALVPGDEASSEEPEPAGRASSSSAGVRTRSQVRKRARRAAPDAGSDSEVHSDDEDAYNDDDDDVFSSDEGDDDDDDDVVISGSQSSDDQDSDQDGGEAAATASSSGTKRGRSGGPAMSRRAKARQEDESNLRNSAYMSGAVPLLIYRNAVKQHPNDLDFSLHFLHLFQQFKGTEMLQQRVLDDLRDSFSSSPDCWAAVAQHVVSGGDGDASAATVWEEQGLRACNVFSDNVNAVEDAHRLWELYAAFVWRYIQSVPRSHATKSKSRLEWGKPLQRMGKKLLSVYAEAEKAGQASAALYLHQIRFLIATKRGSKAVEVAQRSVKLCPESDELWLQLVELLQTDEKLSTIVTVNKTFARAVKAMRSTPNEHAIRVWQAYLSFVARFGHVRKANRGEHVVAFGPWCDLVGKACRAMLSETEQQRSVIDTLKLFAMELGAERWSISENRKLHQLIVHALPPNGSSVYLFILHTEAEWCDTPQAKPSLLRTLANRALVDHGPTCVDLWLFMFQWERSQQNWAAATAMHWRARKELAPSLRLQLDQRVACLTLEQGEGSDSA